MPVPARGPGSSRLVPMRTAGRTWGRGEFGGANLGTRTESGGRIWDTHGTNLGGANLGTRTERGDLAGELEDTHRTSRTWQWGRTAHRGESGTRTRRTLGDEPWDTHQTRRTWGLAPNLNIWRSMPVPPCIWRCLSRLVPGPGSCQWVRRAGSSQSRYLTPASARFFAIARRSHRICSGAESASR